MVRPGFTLEWKCTHYFLSKAYHVSDIRYSIATADCGANATIKVWTARRSSHPQRRVSEVGLAGSGSGH